jgi:UDP-glucose 4-epimerase
MRLLVTGGAGYIGTHTVVALVEAGHDVAVVDNLCNGKREGLRRVEELAYKPIPFYELDVRDRDALGHVFDEHQPEAVLHFAGLKVVSESVHEPLTYYQNNVVGALTLCDVMQQKGVKKIIFSSTAAVYGRPSQLPVPETADIGKAANPYGRSKVMIEDILRDVLAADPVWSVVILRYFNPVGAHPSGRIGDDPHGMPTNLAPVVTRVAAGKQAQLEVFGNDYDTPDGTAMRDFIHVMDLAEGHVVAMQSLEARGEARTYNLGTGQSYSVLDMVRAFEKASGRSVPYVVRPRRVADVAVSYADVHKAAQELHWRARRTLDDMCADAWRWQSRNPDGYA